MWFGFGKFGNRMVEGGANGVVVEGEDVANGKTCSSKTTFLAM